MTNTASKLSTDAVNKPFKVGDRVISKDFGAHAATVIAFFDSVNSVCFVAVETDWGRPYFWRLDLVSAAPEPRP